MVLSKTKKMPLHLWVIALFFIFLYMIGIYDYIMSLSLNTAYFDSQDDGNDQYHYFSNYLLICWTLNLISGMIAPIFLLLRMKRSIILALLSTVALFLLNAITFIFMNRLTIFGFTQSLFDLSILLLTFGLYWYCRYMLFRGYLH
ncbi:hypothetical protein [Virgibacillus sp. CM-4]|uniref:hypothetical protein n=1 Tax=Virgibacillus sp. CM-4 TaxID=1354277 RepID=UPI0012DDB74D|nr:hypothetical protein [Virgibacillus sp. CM-4]